MLVAFIAGFFITRCACDATGVEVEFETGLPPPYVVAVFPGISLGFPFRRAPITAKIVDKNYARFNGDFLKYGNAFVQVFTTSITNVCNGIPWQPLDENPELDERYQKIYAHVASPRYKSDDGRDIWENPDDVQFLSCMDEDRSQAYPISRKVVPLAANNGKIVTTDWMGYAVFADAPEGTEDGKLYPQGIKPKNKGTK